MILEVLVLRFVWRVADIGAFSVQVDFQSSEDEKERLSAELQRLQSLAHNMDDVMRKSQELCSRLSQKEGSQTEDLKVGGNDKDATFRALPSVKPSVLWPYL